jgi:hypothetical protein
MALSTDLPIWGVVPEFGRWSPQGAEPAAAVVGCCWCFIFGAELWQAGIVEGFGVHVEASVATMMVKSNVGGEALVGS